jgi:hypothetical protein
LCNPMMKMKMIIFCPFPSNGAPMEWNWQGKTEELGGKPILVPLCPPQIPHGLTRDRTRASHRRRLTAWAMARPCERVRTSVFSKTSFGSRSKTIHHIGIATRSMNTNSGPRQTVQDFGPTISPLKTKRICFI